MTQTNNSTSKAPYAMCNICPFKDRHIARTTGPSTATVAVVSRSPGYYEALNGKSFEGPSGKVLDHLLAQQGVMRKDVLATNVVLCQSDGPEDEGWNRAVQCCSQRLRHEIANVETIISAGSEASRELVDTFIAIGADRGYVHNRVNSITGKLQRIIITNNPAVVLRDDSSYPELVRDFKLAINPLSAPTLPKIVIIDDVAKAKQAVESMLAQIMPGTIIASDIETRGTEDVKQSGLKHTAEIVCAGFSIRSERAVVFGEKPCLDSGFRDGYLKRIYEIDSARYLWHNGKYDVKVLRNNGIRARVDEDTMLLSWCLDERPGNPESGAGGHSLEWLLKDELGWPKYEPFSVKHFKKTGEIPTPQARHELYEYNGMDTAGTMALFSTLKDKAIADNVWDRPYKSMLIRLSEALTKMELKGIMFDSDRACDLLESEVWPKLRDLKIEARQISEVPTLNLNSPKQLQELMYDSWGLKHKLRRPNIENKGKQSVDRAVREEILLGHFACGEGISRESFGQFAQTFDDFKQLDKQRGTYFEGLVLKRNKDGRIYTDFKIHGTESGRLSGSSPNLQNITRSKEGVPDIRSAFIADPGCLLVSADLSQAELRTIAVLSGDENLRNIYLDTTRSLHKEVAAQFYGSNYSYEQYVRAKNINFGVAYWQSAFSFAQMYHMPESEAQAYINFWWNRFPQVQEWTKMVEEAVLTIGELQSPFGHKRRFYVIPQDFSSKLHVVKQGINYLPQNIAGNITLWAMIKLCEDLDWDIAQPIINVHDNIILNVRHEYVEEIGHMVKSYMEASAKEIIDWQFPFKAEVSVGPNWGSLKEMNL